jgi:TRAP-type C4-dicarboxylate transport system substrate-binding protein
MLTSLQTGLIDATAAPPLFALLDRSFQVANHMLDLNWGALNAATIVSAQSWSRVPAELRPKLVEIARQQGVAMRDVGRKAGEDAVREMTKRGLTVVELTEPERTTWFTEAQKVWPGLRGPFCPADLYDQVMRDEQQFRSGKR